MITKSDFNEIENCLIGLTVIPQRYARQSRFMRKITRDKILSSLIDAQKSITNWNFI